MRIGIEAQRLFRKEKHGIEIVSLEIIKALQLIDCENEYFIFVKDDKDSTCISETENFKIVKVPGSSFPVWEQLQFPKYIKKYKLDVVHCTGNTAPVSIKNRLVLTLHDIIYLENINFKGTAYQNFGNLYRRFIVPRIIKKCDTIITVSEFERQCIINRFKLSPEKVVVIYNAVNTRFNTAFTQEQLAGAKTKYKLPHEFIFFIGNNAHRKNFEGTIKAYIDYARQQAGVLPIVIPGYSIHKAVGLLKKLKAIDLKDKIILPGYISSVEMPLLYNQATLFLYPSFRESFGLPILEAMACGCPVITSNTSSMPEISGGAALLVDPFDPGDISKSISELSADIVLRKSLSEKGIKRAAEFSWHNSATALLSVYRKPFQ